MRRSRLGYRKSLKIDLVEFVVLIGTKDAAISLGVSRKWLKRWLKQNFSLRK